MRLKIVSLVSLKYHAVALWLTSKAGLLGNAAGAAGQGKINDTDVSSYYFKLYTSYRTLLW